MTPEEYRAAVLDEIEASRDCWFDLSCDGLKTRIEIIPLPAAAPDPVRAALEAAEDLVRHRRAWMERGSKLPLVAAEMFMVEASVKWGALESALAAARKAATPAAEDVHFADFEPRRGRTQREPRGCEEFVEKFNEEQR